MGQKIQRPEGFIELLREALPELIEAHPQIFVDALAANREAMRASFEKAGFNFADSALPSTQTVRALRQEAIDEGRIVGGFGARYRKGLRSVRRYDAAMGRFRNTYLTDDIMPLCEAWARALLNKHGIDEVTRKDMRTISEELNKATRAPNAAMTAEPGTSGGYLVPTVIAAEIYEEMVERFVLQNKVEVYTSAAPLQIPRRMERVKVSRGAPATDIEETQVGLGSVKLSPERVAALAYIEPQLALAAAVGPVRYIVAQIAEAMAEDKQRCFIAGDPNLREPRGVNTLPTGTGIDKAKTTAFVNTDIASRRDSLRRMYYSIKQRHRESPRALWVVNNDGMQLMASLNDTNQRPFKDAENGNPPQFMGKEVVESSAILTNGTDSSAIFGDWGQYAYQESPDGLVVEQTTVGGAAWVSGTIGVRAIEHTDGAPVIPAVWNISPIKV